MWPGPSPPSPCTAIGGKDEVSVVVNTQAEPHLTPDPKHRPRSTCSHPRPLRGRSGRPALILLRGPCDRPPSLSPHNVARRWRPVWPHYTDGETEAPKPVTTGFNQSMWPRRHTDTHLVLRPPSPLHTPSPGPGQAGAHRRLQRPREAAAPRAQGRSQATCHRQPPSPSRLNPSWGGQLQDPVAPQTQPVRCRPIHPTLCPGPPAT